MTDCPVCQGTGDIDGEVCSACEGTGRAESVRTAFDAVWIAGAWKAVVEGKMQKPDFQDRGAALAFAEPASRGARKREPIEET